MNIDDKYQYEDGKLKRSFKRQHIEDLPKTKRYNLVNRINPHSTIDMGILGSWMHYLRDLDVPFVVKVHKTGWSYPTKHWVLWKELVVQDG